MKNILCLNLNDNLNEKDYLSFKQCKSNCLMFVQEQQLQFPVDCNYSQISSKQLICSNFDYRCACFDCLAAGSEDGKTTMLLL